MNKVQQQTCMLNVHVTTKQARVTVKYVLPTNQTVYFIIYSSLICSSINIKLVTLETISEQALLDKKESSEDWFVS